MPLRLMYLTNDPDIAVICENAGVERIFIDIEVMGKKERQGKYDTVISNHDIGDVGKIKNVLKKAKILTRINPIYEGTRHEIEEAIEGGTDHVMLPMVKTGSEARDFVRLVDKRAGTCLLVENKEACGNLDDILSVEGIDEVYIGLNDLHISYGLDNMFEFIINGMLEELAGKIRKRGLPFGFGGIARLESGMIPAKYIITEHYRLGSTIAILSRTFYNYNGTDPMEDIDRLFRKEIGNIRDHEKIVGSYDKEKFRQNTDVIRKLIERRTS